MRQSTFVKMLLLGCIVLAMGAVPTTTQSTRDLALQCIEAAAKIAVGKAPETQGAIALDGRSFSLLRVALAYAEIGDVQKAQSVAAAISDKPSKEKAQELIAACLANNGDVDAAVSFAKASANQSALRFVATIWGRTDPKRALAIAEELKDPLRSYAYARILQCQVLAGDIRGAEKTAEMLADAQERAKGNTELWLAAGHVMETGGEIKKSAAKLGVKSITFQQQLSEIGQAKAKTGKLADAERILDALESPERRARVRVAMAEHQLYEKDKKRFALAIELAEKETAAVPDDEMAEMIKGSLYLQIAALHVRAGQLEAGLTAIKQAHAWGDKEQLGVFKALGGQVAVVNLYILAGRLDEADKAAVQADGTMFPDAIPSLVAAYEAAGNLAKAEKLLKVGASSGHQFDLYLSVAGAIAEQRSNQVGGMSSFPSSRPAR